MANSVIQLKYSNVTGNTPSSLANGEIAINSYDGKIFYRGGVSNTIQSFLRYSGPAGLDTEVQFNDGGVLGANSRLTFNKSTGLLSTNLLRVTQSAGDEGGQIDLSLAATNQSLSGTVAIDIYQNRLRIFETSGTNRGVFIDLANSAAAGVGTDLLQPASSTDGWARNQANAAFIAANSAGVYANGAFAAANSAGGGSAGIYANGAFVAANSAGVYANGAFAAANAATATDATQNTNITNAGNYANGAFVAANSAGVYANGAFTRANNSLNANTGGTVTGNVTFQLANRGIDGVAIQGPTGSLRLMPNSVQGNYNGIVQANDISAIFSSGTQGLGAFTLAAWNSINSGVRIGANGNVVITSANTTSVDSNTGALVISNGLGVTGNLFLSSANNFSGPGNGGSYRLGWTDNYFFRSTSFNGVYFTGNFLSINGGTFYVEGSSSAIIRSSIYNDTAGARLLLNGQSGVNIANIMAATSTTTGALIVGGGVGVSGSVYADAIFDGGVEVITFAGNAYNTANAAFLKANNEGGVNNTQNTNITNAQNSATAAFNAANTADTKATSAGIYANGAFAAANAATATDATQNNSITAAFTAANSAGVYANGAFVRANNSLSANAGGTVTGNVTIVGDLAITGNVTLTGNAFSINVGTLVANDSLIVLAGSNYTSDSLDIGIIAHYNAGTNAHTGLIRDFTTKEWYLFKNYTPEIGSNNNIDINNASFTLDTLNANLDATLITVKNIDLLTYVNAAFAAANAATATDTTQNNSITAAFNAANTADVKATSAGIYANGAFAAANAATATDATQNTNITNAQNSATAAFNAANTADTKATSAGIYANGAFVAANNRALKVGDTFTGNVSIANGNLIISNATTAVSNTTGALVVTGGAGIRGSLYADAIYDGGIEVILFAQNAYNTGNAAFTVANTASDRSLSAGIYANGAFAAANAATATDATQNNSITAAFNTANTASDRSLSAGIYANGAFEAANSAGVYANAAFAAANSASGGSSGIYANGAFVAANSAGVYANGAFAAANAAYSPSNPPPASGVGVDIETNSNTTYYPLFSNAITGTISTAYVDTSALYFVPSTGVLSANVFVSLSDKNYKNNIIKISDATNTVIRLEGVSFNWKHNNTKSYGVVAQDIEKVIPEVVQTNEKGIKSVNYDSIIGFLIEAIKQQNEEIVKLKAEIHSINSRLGK